MGKRFTGDLVRGSITHHKELRSRTKRDLGYEMVYDDGPLPSDGRQRINVSSRSVPWTTETESMELTISTTPGKGMKMGSNSHRG